MNAPNVLYFRKQSCLRALALWAACLLVFNPTNAGLKTGADFLKIPVGAEPSALGNAYTAMAHGVSSLNWNPAGLANTSSSLHALPIGISFSHQAQLAENNLDHLGFSMPAGKSSLDSWGVNLLRLSYAEQTRRDANRQTTGHFAPSDMSVGAALAHNFGRYQAGTQLKLIRMDLDGAHAQGFAVDLGFLTQMPNRNLSVGFAARNLGPRMKFIDEKFDLPLTLSLGSAYQILSPLVLSCDLEFKPLDQQTTLSFGTEFMASKNIALRAGYAAQLASALPNGHTTAMNDGNFANVSGLAAGFGLGFRQFNLDYSITPFGELGNAQMLTLSTWFGANAADKDSADAPAADLIDPNKDGPPKEELNDRMILILPIAPSSRWWE